jgi:hypothetical protein
MITDYLRHTIDIVSAQSLNDAGEILDGIRTAGTRCLIQGSRSRVIMERGQEIQADFMVTFGPDEEIFIGDRLENGFDALGNTELISSARIVAIRDIIHPVNGRLGREATVKRN